MAMGLSVLGYRPWKGQLHGSWASPWPISRIALLMVFRRKLFWGLYVVGLLNFLLFFSGIYLFSQIDLGNLAGANPGMIRFWNGVKETLEEKLFLDGKAQTYAYFFWIQGYIVAAILALAGSTIVGNDYQFGSLPFYLAKPLGRWHYLTGKLLAVALFVNMLTTFPALVLHVERGLLHGWEDYQGKLHLLPGILAYGGMITVTLSLLVVTVASGLRKTVPLIMAWIAILIFGRLFASALVDLLNYDPRWRLLDVWNDLYLLGTWFLHVPPNLDETGAVQRARPQPAVWEAAVVLGVVCTLCLAYLNRRIRAVEVVR